MKKIILKQIAVFSVFALTVALIDRLIKFIALTYLQQEFNILEGILKFSLEKNQGIAFSINIPIIMQIVVFPVLLGVGLYFIYKYFDIKKYSVLIISGLITGAAIGNFIDRVFYGYVIDYISISVFPVFNFADILIVAGIFIFILFYGKIKRV